MRMLIKVSYREDIESKRKEMIKAAKEYGLNSDKTIQCSQELDHMLNQYNKCIPLGSHKDKKV